MYNHMPLKSKSNTSKNIIVLCFLCLLSMCLLAAQQGVTKFWSVVHLLACVLISSFLLIMLRNVNGTIIERRKRQKATTKAALQS